MAATLWILAGAIGLTLAILIWGDRWGARAASAHTRMEGRPLNTPKAHALILGLLLGLLPIALGIAIALGAD